MEASVTTQTSTGQLGTGQLGAGSPAFSPGLEGVIAFETDIAEPDRDGGALRYRGVDIFELVGIVDYGKVWELLVDGEFGDGLPDAEPMRVGERSGDVRGDVQAGLAQLGPRLGYRPLLDEPVDVARAQLAIASAAALAMVARSARGSAPEVPDDVVARGGTLAERFLLRWRGEADPLHARALDAYWVATAEHGLNASTFTARVVASTGADVTACLSAAVGALSGPLHGGAPARVLPLLERAQDTGDPAAVVRDVLDSGNRLMGFGHRVYRAEDPRARVLRQTCKELGAPRYDAAVALEQAALAELRERRPDRAIETNVEFWAAVTLDAAQVPADVMPALFTCARTAGWAAHILEQKRTGRLVRPSARYTGPAPRPATAVPTHQPRVDHGRDVACRSPRTTSRP
jgi:citrate synthase